MLLLGILAANSVGEATLSRNPPKNQSRHNGHTISVRNNAGFASQGAGLTQVQIPIIDLLLEVLKWLKLVDQNQ